MVDSFVSALCPRHASETAVKSLSLVTQVIGSTVQETVEENQVNCAEVGNKRVQCTFLS